MLLKRGREESRWKSEFLNGKARAPRFVIRLPVVRVSRLEIQRRRRWEAWKGSREGGGEQAEAETEIEGKRDKKRTKKRKIYVSAEHKFSVYFVFFISHLWTQLLRSSSRRSALSLFCFLCLFINVWLSRYTFDEGAFVATGRRQAGMAGSLCIPPPPYITKWNDNEISNIFYFVPFLHGNNVSFFCFYSRCR